MYRKLIIFYGQKKQIFWEISAISFAGNASGAGLPAEKGMTLGSDEFFSISRITEGFKAKTRSEN